MKDMQDGRMNYLFLVLCVSCLMLASLPATAAGLPPELREAETKYGKAVQALLEKADDDLDVRKKLGALNESFLKHLRDISPKLLARNAAYGPLLAERIELMKWKTSFSLELTALDARKALNDLSGKAGVEEDVAAKGTDAPEGELESREAEGEVTVGESFDIKGKTKNIPDGHIVQVFAAPSFGSMFPRENRKPSNKRFAVTEYADSVWVGPMQFHLMSLPEKVMDEVDLYIAARQQWQDGGFKDDAVPPFHGKPTRNLYLSRLEELGGIRLASIKLAYVR